MRQRPLLVVARVEEDRHDDRRAAHVSHLVLGDQVEDRLRPHLSQAHMQAGFHADRPGEAPAVAMEHRQRPKIDRMAADIAGEDIARGEQVRAAMMVDNAFRIAGRARGVVERNRIPFVARRRAPISLVPLGDQRLVVEVSQPLAGAVVLGVVVVDNERPSLGPLERHADDCREFTVDDERFGFAVIEHEGD